MARVPIILMGKEYWAPFFEWIKNYMLQERFISRDEMDIVIITDDVAQAASIIVKECKGAQQSKFRNEEIVHE